MSGLRVASGLVVVAALAGAVWIGVREFDAAEEASLAIAPIRHGEFLAVIPTRGQILAARNVPVYAPLVQGLRVSWMAPVGDLIGEGEPMVRFDSSSAELDMIQRRSELEQAEAALEQAVVEAEVAAEHDERDLVDAHYAVELAELRTAANEFVGRLEAEQGEIDLRLARQDLRQKEAEIAQNVVSRESRIASLQRQLDLAAAEVEVLESRIADMEVRAPQTGYAIYASGSSGSIISLAEAIFLSQLGGGRQPLRVGDEVSAGMNLATIPDLSSLVIDVTVEEIDRGRIEVGDPVIVRVDALPDMAIETTLSEISALAESSSSSQGRSFHVYAALGAEADARIRPGMNGSMDIVIDRIPDAMIVPAPAVFTRSGRPVVYQVVPDGFETVEVQVLARNSDEIAVAGIEKGARVALVDPFESQGGEIQSEAPK